MTHLDIKNLKVGDIFFEAGYGVNLAARVTTQPVFDNDQWAWKAENVFTGEEISYLLTEGLRHYGPKLSPEPEYVYLKDGEIFYKFLGCEELEREYPTK